MKIHHVSITVNNLEESTKFYREMLGFEVEMSFERKDLGAKATFIKLKEFQMELWQFEEMKKNVDPLDDIKIRGIRHIAFGVQDLDETVKKLKNKGLVFKGPKQGASGRYAFTTDPNGIALEFYEE